MSTYLDQLNPAQKSAVLATEGPVMVIAGAGSGKTRVLTYRIAYLMERGVDSFNILSLTFTNKAAREMKERIARLVGDSEARNLWMGTFHSVFARILRAEGHHLGYPSNFTIYDTEDARKVITNLIKEMNLDKEIYKPKTVQNRISAFKNNLITPKIYDRREELIAQDSAAKMPLMGSLYTAYLDRCFRSGAMDFDDLLLKTNELLAKFPAVLAKYQDRFKYIMVDEYQDTNHSQYIIVKALASRFENVCVVGDDAQSIYSFRGANIQNILNFNRDYPEANIYKLEQNYRSSQHIVKAANSIIAHNQDQLQKKVWTSNEEGELITVFKAISDYEESNYVSEQIFEWSQRNQWHYGNFSILYRTNAQSRSFEDALRRRNIPYRIYGGLSFYQRKEVKDVLAYFRLALNNNDEEAFRRVVNLPKRGIGDTTLDRLNVLAQENRVSLFEVAENAILSSQAGIQAATCKRLADFCAAIRSYAVEIEKRDAFSAADYVVRGSGLLREMEEDKTPEGASRVQNVEELLNAIQDFADGQLQIEDGDPSLSNFVQDIALITDADNSGEDDGKKVALMTVHLAKGLEFPCVFVVGMEESLFPSMMAMNTRTELEEERRLFYVALTRAEKKAFLTYAHSRFRWGKTIDCEPSRFIDEIDEQHLDLQIPDFNPFSDETFLPYSGSGFGKGSSARFQKKLNKSEPPKTVDKPTIPPVKGMRPLSSSDAIPSYERGQGLKEVVKGMRVQHARFGTGTVTFVEGEGPNAKATIQFDHGEEKKLLMKFAKLKTV
jgi:DNA helicase II / ATP-dependent DNA helicase PcrA